jgi:hypothetical protein
VLLKELNKVMTAVEAIHKCNNKEEYIALRHSTRLLALLTENQIKITDLKSHQHNVSKCFFQNFFLVFNQGGLK